MQLQSQQTHIDGILDYDASHVCFFELADAEDAPEGLLFDGVIPP